MNATPLSGNWDLMILDAEPPVRQLGNLGVGDIDRDGNVEIVTGGNGGLLWYRPATHQRGIIAEGNFHVGLALEDVDGDGILEVVVGDTEPCTAIYWFKPTGDLTRPWARYTIDPDAKGGAHDLLFVDLDGDGVKELLANQIRDNLGLYAYKPGPDPKEPWSRHAIVTGIDAEGLAAADLDGDGRIEICFGPEWYIPPKEGPFAGQWTRRPLAKRFREMCRVAVVDITGNGRPDVVICESEYPDGLVSWFENRIAEDPENPWIEHPLGRGFVFAHSLVARRDRTGTVSIFIAEMAEGGWRAPRNRDARLVEYATSDGGKSWNYTILYQGCGTHEALLYDADRDGTEEIVGKQWLHPKVQIWKRRDPPAGITRFRHQFVDRDKPATATDILAVDVNGDGLPDLVCGRWWYKNPSWCRYEIPGISQVINAFDIDGDGREELIATKGPGLTSDLCWLKPVDPENGRWTEYPIGKGSGDWPHGSTIAPVLADGRLGLIVGYHSADSQGHFPEIFEIPQDPTKGPWNRRVLAEIPYGEEIVSCDIDGDGLVDIIAGTYLLHNLGNGRFDVVQIASDFHAARVRVADINGDGRPDIILGEELLDFENKITPRARLAWFENPGNLDRTPWQMHIIDTIRCPHSIDVADLDGDGELEIICGEHDPFRPYRSRSRLMVYKRAEPHGLAWYRYVLDDRFEHHDGTKVFEIQPGRLAIASHAWKESRYVHLWVAE